MRLRNRPDQVPDCFDPRLRLVALALCVLVGILLTRLWIVQVQQGAEHSKQLSRQNVRRIRLNPSRGRLFATDGDTLLADTRPSYDLVFHLAEMRQPGPRENTIEHIVQTAERLGKLIGRPSDMAPARPERHLRVYPALPMTVFSDLDKRELATVVEHLPRERAVRIRVSSRRHYPMPGLATHILGFAGRRPPPDPFERDRYSYVRPELHGRAGLEKQYDSDLAGRPGLEMVRVDTLGFAHSRIGELIPAEPGADLVLTIDARAQQIAERLLAGKIGAIVVVDVSSGAVRVCASSPTYDLAELDADTYSALAADEDRRPLINRAVDGSFLPGSIVKPLIALAALNSGNTTPERVINCPGYVLIGNARIHCWYRPGHGGLNIRSAIEQSCNVYFIRVGMQTGLDAIRPMMLATGFGQRPGIDLPNATDGLVPSRRWAYGQWERGWLAIDTAYLSIGQGAVNISPLQAAVYAAALANGGTVYRPYLVQEVRTPQGKARRRTIPTPVRRLPVSRQSLEIVQDGMVRVVNGDHATARRARTPVISLAGKTGTAEVGPRDDRTHNTWFICYGPIESPRYAAAVLVRHGVSGGRTAAPLAKKLFSGWLAAE